MCALVTGVHTYALPIYRGSKPLFRNGDRACLIDGKAGVPRDFPDIAVCSGDMGAIAAPGHVARRVGDCAARPGPRSHYLVHLGAGADIVRQSDPAKASMTAPVDARLGAQILDRKSTRLNSSH